MAIRVALKHRTEYHYDRAVTMSPHQIRLRPAPHTRTPVHHYALDIEPKPHFINWQQDPFGNYIARLVFPEKTRRFVVDVSLIADLVTINPFDFYTEAYANEYGFEYEAQLHKELKPYFEIKEEGPLLKELLKGISREPEQIVDFLVGINADLQKRVGYTIRMEPGIQTCEETLSKGTGSCRDSAWLQVQVLRHLGLAARFVSGYLVQLTADEKSLDGPSGPEADFTDLHAWTEVFIPGAGWVGMDPTSGLFAGEGHIPLACTPDPVSAAPIVGGTSKCEVSFEFENKVTRVHEDPRVTKPYTEKQWQSILSLGDKVDETLIANDVRLTMGGEPTFVSIDDMDSPQWNTAALGEHKLERAGVLLRRLKKAFGHDAVLHYGQGKWYPGEQLPRWAMHCYWRADKKPTWLHPELLDDPATKGDRGVEEARKLMASLAKHLDVDVDNASTGYEDGAYYIWKEGTLPKNVNVVDNRLSDPVERERIRRVFEQGLDKEVGFALPLAWDYGRKSSAGSPVRGGWASNPWEFRREHMFLLPGDSPMGFRLPLDSLVWEPKTKRQMVQPADPQEPKDELPAIRDRMRLATRPSDRWDSPRQMEHPEAADAPLPEGAKDLSGEFIRTALCVEPRNGHLHIFLPPLSQLEHYLDLVSSIEAAAVECDLPVIMEGYEPPHDHRLKRFSVTPDPGVIEVNIHPASDWRELVRHTETLYAEARQSRLGTEKFMLDGRHTGTGGGNHVTIGGATPSDSPMLRRPHLLKSLLAYWQNHPSLSYLFSGMFVGPTSQAPRVDEARDDALYELGIAFSEIPAGEAPAPWMVDRILRHLLADITGNTHRSEFCIDKLYSPDSASGRLGLVEFRGFEMPPHSR
ncbi:MAG: DUF2126 domain-containing protein, partial [Gammaproteobacteria bacterium]